MILCIIFLAGFSVIMFTKLELFKFTPRSMSLFLWEFYPLMLETKLVLRIYCSKSPSISLNSAIASASASAFCFYISSLAIFSISYCSLISIIFAFDTKILISSSKTNFSLSPKKHALLFSFCPLLSFFSWWLI